MKKLLKFIPLLSLFLIFACTFGGCIFTIPAPQLTLNGNFLEWETDGHAQKYEVVLNEKSIYCDTSGLNVAYYVQESGKQTAKIKAFSKNIFYNDSAYSEEFSFDVASTKLSKPTNVSVQATNHKYIASWNTVSQATAYVIKLVNNTTKQIDYIYTTTNSKDITQNLSQSGTFVAFVRALSDDLTVLAPSDYVGSDEFRWVTYIKTPVVSLSGNMLSWPKVDGAKQYVVATQEGKTKTVSTNSLNVFTSGLLSSNNITVFFVQAIANDNAGFDSVYSDGVSFFEDTSTSGLSNTKLEYMNTSFDLFANSENELKCIAFYAMYYRIKEIKFTMDFTTNYDTAIKNQLNQYDEIMSISYGVSSFGSLVTLKITFVHPNTPTITAEGDITVVQDSNIKPVSYTKTPRSDDFDEFLINSREKSLTVFNSDQLYIALQNGYKPNFTSDSSPAKVVFEQAKDVLREIVDDSMTELQKANAIYEWLSYKTRYDYNLLNITEKLESSKKEGAQSELSKYKGFYIEGIMLDNGQAVCDGISKTFVLLTNLENLTCYKVSGTASGGNHAWNKICLDLDDDGEGEWYTIDVTWGDLTRKEGNTYTEYLAHSYYLVSDDMITLNSHQELSPLTDESQTDFSFYQNKILTDGVNSQSLLITSQSDLTRLMSIVSNLGLEGIEFAVKDTSVSLGLYRISYNVYEEQLKMSIKSRTVNMFTGQFEYTYDYLNIYCLSAK